MQTDRHKHAYTNTNNICISEHWSEAKHGCDDPFSHINKHHLSWMSTGLMLRSFCCLKYQLFIKRERVFNRVPSLFIHREWQKNPKELDFFFNAVNFLYKNFPTLWSGQASVLMSFFCFPSFEREGDSRLDRVDERTTIYQMAHCVFLFLGSLTLLNIEMRHQLGFSGKKCEISWSQCIDLSPSALDWRNGLKNCQGKKNVMKQIWNPYN